MILIMFLKDLNFFPTLREIRDELIQAQMHDIEVKSKIWKRHYNFH